MGKDFEMLVKEYYSQELNSAHNSSICYSETYNESDVVYLENEKYSESVKPEDLGSPF